MPDRRVRRRRGVWGGLSEHDRHTARVGHPELAPDRVLAALRRWTTSCGTDYGYWDHLRHGEMPCDGCRVAHGVALPEGHETPTVAPSEALAREAPGTGKGPEDPSSRDIRA